MAYTLLAAGAVCAPDVATPAAQPADDPIETLLVTGKQPGPGLWKVSRGDHVLWILGGSGPLPKDMVWRSGEVEARVAESQEVLYSGFANVGVDVGLLRALTLVPAMIKAAKNPDGAKLKDVLPPATYARWTMLKERYIGKGDGVEKWRPALALGQLRGEAFGKSGLGFAVSARAVVDQAAKKHRVRVTQLPRVERQVHVEDPRGLLKRAAKREFDDLECFERGLEELEPDLERAKVFANAWASGDIEALRANHTRQRATGEARRSCEDLMLDALADEPDAKALLDGIKAQSHIATRANEWNWLQAARRALRTNRSTFAILPMSQLFAPDGYVAKLRAEGYDVAEP